MRALAVLALLGALVAGCGANDPLAAEQISAAAEETAEAGSSRIELTGVDGDDRFTMTGAADYEAGTARLTFEGTTDGEPESGELRLLGDTFYVRSEQFLAEESPEQLARKEWFSLTLSKEDRAESLEALVLPFPFVDPAGLLATFQQVSGEVTRLGVKDVRGVPTDGYRLTLDLSRLVEQAPQKHRKALRSELARRAEKTLPVEVWIDSADRARRVVLAPEEGVDATIDFFDFGVAVDVQAPPKETVLDASVFWEGEESASSDIELEPVQTIEEDE